MKRKRNLIKRAAAMTLAAFLFTQGGLPAEYKLSIKAEAAKTKEIAGFEPFDYETNTLVFAYCDKPDLATLLTMMPETISVYLNCESKATRIPVTWECVGDDYEADEYYYYQFSPVIDESAYTVAEDIDWYVDAPYIGVHLVTEEEGYISILDQDAVSAALGVDSSLKVSGQAQSKVGNEAEKAYSPVSTTAPEAEQDIFEYLSEVSGYNTAVICGIMANLYHESGFLSNNLQNSYESRGYTDASYTRAVDNGTYRYKSYTSARSSFKYDSAGYGLCQWTASARKEGLYDRAKAEKVSISDMAMQLEYMLSEVSSSLKSTLKSCPNTADGAYKAGYNWCYYFEAPSRRSSASRSRGNLAKNSFWPQYKQYTASDSGVVYSTGYYRINVDSVNVRAEAGLSSNRLGTAKRDEFYKVTEVNGGWGKITYEGSVGWISLKYADYVRSVYYIEFDSQGGSGSMNTMTAAYGYNNYLTKCAFLKDGYRFTGWYAFRQSDGKWNTESGWKTEEQIRENGYTKYLYDDGESVSKTSSVDEDTIIMYAQWKKIKRFYIEFDGNSGSGTMERQTCVYGDSNVLKACSFVKTGCHLKGWVAWRESDGKWLTTESWKTEEEIAENGYEFSLYKDKSTLSKTSSIDGDTIILYAQWEINTFTVKYDKNDSAASGSMSSTTVTYGTATKLRANSFTKTGYTFTGWHAYRASDNKCYTTSGWKTESEIKSGGYTKYNYSNKASVSKTTPVNKDVVTMYAQWKANTFKVVFNANGGSGSMDPITVTYGVSKKLTANKFTKAGYTFAGWYAYRSSDGKWYTESGWKTAEQISAGGYKKAVYSDGASLSKTTSKNNDTITLYAVWKKS